MRLAHPWSGESIANFVAGGQKQKRRCDEGGEGQTNKLKLARTRVERVKAKARVLSNNDLYEVYILRMQEEAKKNVAKQKS